MLQSIEVNLDNVEQLALIAKALSAEVRIEIMKLLCEGELKVNEIAERLNIPASSAAMAVKTLEEAGLIATSLQPGIRGSMKVSKKVLDKIEISLDTKSNRLEKAEVISMPIGNYVDYKVQPTCGLVSEKGPIDKEDEPGCFYNPDRTFAKLLWFGKGYVEYRFSNNRLKVEKEKSVELSMEICSEDHEYNLHFPSDITVWINEIEAGTWNCKSDYGGRRGKLNPNWWPDKNTQYGMIKTWKLTENGTYIDQDKVTNKTLHDFKLSEGEYISVRIGIKEDAQHVGGINLFGDCFGDHAQNILLKFIF